SHGRSESLSKDLHVTDSVNGPLKGIRVLDLSTVVAGPFGTDILASLGAEVVRISPPGGSKPVAPRNPDETVSDGDGFVLALQRGKKSVTLNLKDEADREAFYRLVKVSDVVYDNYRPGVT